LTGWTFEQLRAQPADVVRGLMQRIFAERAWEPGVAALARRPILRSAYSSAGAWGEAERAKAAAARGLAEIEGALWPEGDDA